jgi:predicted amidohydrolase YtcJ
MTRVLYRGGHLYSPADPHATALLASDGVIGWLGADGDAPAADLAVDLDGALVTPAFVDAHVHTTDAGLALTGLDLSGIRSGAALLDEVGRVADRLPSGAVVLGHGWDESTWSDQSLPDAAALDRAAGGRRVYLSQASVHSALCSAALLPAAAGLPGYDPAGWVRREAHHAVREAAFAAIDPAQRTAAQQAALRRAAELGIAAVHECGGPGIGAESDFTHLLTLSGDHGPAVYGLWGELMGAAKAKELGAAGAGGDLFADGALGARTAHVREPYLDGGGGTGVGYLTSDQVRDHLLDCHDVGVPGGFHAIGDAALATVLAGFAAAALRIGVERLRAGRHRIEHAELLDRDLISAMVGYGVVASVQPAFDRLWGGERQMYAQRLGVRRSLASNPLGAMHSVGVTLAFGSDAPVTPLDPWGSVRAAMWHHNPAYRMSGKAAFAAHTRGGWRAVGEDQHGVLVPGAPATFAAWRLPDGAGPDALPELHPDAALPTCRRTVLHGTTIYEEP